MFERCGNLGSINLDGWNAPKVTSCWFMLYGTAAEAIDLSGVTFGKIDSAQSLFSDNYSLKSVKFGAGIDFSSTTKMHTMFYYCGKLQLDCSEWNVRADAEHGDFNEGAPGVILPEVWQ